MANFLKPTEPEGKKMHEKPDNETCIYEGSFKDLKVLRSFLGDKKQILIKDPDGLYWYFYVR